MPKAKAEPKVETEDPIEEAARLPEAVEPKPKRFATSSDIPDVAYSEIELPRRRTWVRVRHLGAPELATMAVLPELSAFTMLMQKQIEAITGGKKKKGDELSDDENRTLVGERIRYMVKIAHVAVIADPSETNEIECACGLRHLPSLWTEAQSKLLAYDDLAAISRVAENVEALDPTSPSSGAETAPSTDKPVATGA